MAEHREAETSSEMEEVRILERRPAMRRLSWSPEVGVRLENEGLELEDSRGR